MQLLLNEVVGLTRRCVVTFFIYKVHIISYHIIEQRDAISAAVREDFRFKLLLMKCPVAELSTAKCQTAYWAH